MERATVEIYDDRGLGWAASHATAGCRAEAESFARRVPLGALRIDVGCGAGRYLPHLGTPAIAFDASAVMLDACRREVPGGLPVLGDVEHLPFAAGSIAGAWSWMTHLHVPRVRLPMALWDLQRVLAVGAPFELQVLEGEYEGDALPGDDVGGRFFAGWPPDRLAEVATGAGFDVDPDSVTVSATRCGCGRPGPGAWPIPSARGCGSCSVGSTRRSSRRTPASATPDPATASGPPSGPPAWCSGTVTPPTR